MRFILSIVILTFSLAMYAHEKHEDLKSQDPLPGASVYQLDSQWTDQNGHKIKLGQLSGARRIVVLLYTKCQTACPLIVNEVQEVLSALPEDKTKSLPVTVFSIDSKNETPKTLKAFEKKRKLGENWQLLTGEADAVATLAAALGFRYKKLPNGEYIHSNTIYLLDEKGVVRAHKDGFQSSNEGIIKAVTGKGPA